MHVAMLGTRGVPAQYGGFETAIEEIGARLVDAGHRVTVYCRNTGQTIISHRGMDLVNLGALRRRSLETLSHTALSVGHTLRNRPHVAVLFNAGNAPYIPLLKAGGIPTAVHVDGLEWKRAKWQGAGARYYRWAERYAARSGLPLIADAQGIADHLRDTYGADSHVIPYGAPILAPGTDRLVELDLTPGSYHLAVARLEPENHVDVIVRGYAKAHSRHPLLVVGSAPYGDTHIAGIRRAAATSDTRFVGAVWDQDLLNQLYAGSLSYLHGHSVGGTNPSLLRALGCAAPVTAFDVNFNREVTDGHARFFDDPTSVASAILADDADPEAAVRRGRAGQEHAGSTYRWDDVAERYLQLLTRIARR